MKNVSANFHRKIAAGVKKIDKAVLISWQKEIDDARAFATYDESFYDGGDIYWSGNQDTVAFGDRYAYTNETKFCQNFKISRKISNRPWGVICGSAEITLNNTTGRFFAGKDAEIGAYVNLPNRPVKLQVAVDGEYINLFTGYGDRPETTILKSDLTMRALDAVSYLSTKTSAHDPMVGASADEIMRELILEAGFSTEQFALDPSLQNPIDYISLNGLKVADILAKLCEAEGYIIFADGDGIIRGWNQQHLHAEVEPVWKFNFSNIKDARWSSASIINDVLVRAKPFRFTEKSKIFAFDQAGESSLIPANGTLEFFANLKDASGGVIYAIDIDWPDGITSNFTANTKTDDSGDDKTLAISLSSMYNFGDNVKMVFSNPTSTPIYITKLELFGTSAQQKNADEVEAIDDASVENFGANPDDGEAPMAIENEFIQEAGAAKILATNLVNGYAEPHNKFDIDSFVVPELEFGDTVEIEIENLDEAKNVQILGIETTVGASGDISQAIFAEELETYSLAYYDAAVYDEDVYG